MEADGFPPTTVNALPEIVACETFTVAVPVFVTVKLCAKLLPTETFPKVRLVELGERTPAPGVPGCPPDALVKPAQLDRPMIAEIAAKAARRAMGERRIECLPSLSEMGRSDR